MSDLLPRLRPAHHSVAALDSQQIEELCDDAADEIERQRQLIEDIDASGIHSCHDRCQRVECVQRREIERLRAWQRRAVQSMRWHAHCEVCAALVAEVGAP